MENRPKESGCVVAGSAAIIGGLTCLFCTFVPPTIVTMVDQITPRVTEYSKITESLLEISVIAAIPAFAVGALGGIYLYNRSRRPPD